MQDSTANHTLTGRITARTVKARRKQKLSWWRKPRWWGAMGGGMAAIVLAVVLIQSAQPAFTEAPEAKKILAAQEGLDFGILIPTYMPSGFDRGMVDIRVTPAEAGPSGAPMVDLTYRNLRQSAAIFLRQWVPGTSGTQTLIFSAPIETNWGTGWLRRQSGDSGMLASLWVDIGQLRVEVATPNAGLVTPEHVVQIANTLGLASEDQVYSFKMEPIAIRGVAPPPPFEVKTNSEGIQEFNLTITPGGYSPARFIVKKGVPVRINFRNIGEVGSCGRTGMLDLGNQGSAPLSVTVEKPFSVVEFTPEQAGTFNFNDAHFTYRGEMTVIE